MTRFCLIRHGQTDWNLEGRYQGQSDAPLNNAGRSQAVALGRLLRDQSFSAIYSSDLIRAKETAEILSKALDLPVKIDIRLREINQGKWEGKLVTVIQARYSEFWQKRKMDPANFRPPGGETVGEVAVRAYEALDEIAFQFLKKNVLVVSHGLTLATILCKVKGVSLGQAYQLIPENTKPIWVEWKH